MSECGGGTRERPSCPKCGSKSIASILWGRPVWTEELESQLEEGSVVLGGCCIEGDDPCWKCRTCGHQFGIFDAPNTLGM